jgi:hypothetical protein
MLKKSRKVLLNVKRICYFCKVYIVKVRINIKVKKDENISFCQQ